MPIKADLIRLLLAHLNEAIRLTEQDVDETAIERELQECLALTGRSSERGSDAE